MADFCLGIYIDSTIAKSVIFNEESDLLFLLLSPPQSREKVVAQCDYAYYGGF
jgi:hypothetical protein